MISLTLPSIYPEALERSLRNIEDTAQGRVQVIVCSPFRIGRSLRNGEIVWCEDRRMEGCNAGHYQAAKMATGEFTLAWVDDHLFVPNWDVEAIAEFEAREELSDGPFMLGLRQAVQPQSLECVGTVFGIYYPYFPMIRTEIMKYVGWFNPGYQVGFADVDLAFRMRCFGGTVEWSEQALITVHPDDNERRVALTTDNDMAVFLARWVPIYGDGWSTKMLRDFNKDIPLCSLRAGTRTLPL